MERPHTRSYSQKLRVAAVQAHIREGKTIAEATALYGISDTSLLRRWCRGYYVDTVGRNQKNG